MRDFDWKILSTLYTTKNITRTAELLFTGQPNVTKHIKAMEEKFGFPIVVRTGSGITFTARGEHLAERAVEVERMLQKVYLEIGELSSESKGVIRVAATNSFVRTQLPGILERYCEAYPQVSFQLRTCLTDETPRLLKSRDIDVIFSHMEGEDASYKYRYNTEAMVVASREGVDLEQLPRLSQITCTRSSYIRSMINQWWASRYRQPQKIVLTVNGIDSCQEIVSRGLGYSFFFESQLNQKCPLNTQLILKEDGMPLTRDTWMCCPEAGYSRRIVREFVAFIEHEGLQKDGAAEEDHLGGYCHESQ